MVFKCNFNKLIISLFFSFLLSFFQLISESNPIEVRMARIYGMENEKLPPILIMQNVQGEVPINVGSNFLTFEMDIYADVPPNVYAEFVHCDLDWNEDQNAFLNNPGFMRTSDFVWESSYYSRSYYSHRGKLKFPNAQVRFKYSGNYKLKVYSYYGNSEPLTEARFFVVEPIAKTEMYFGSIFYRSKYQITNSGYNIEVRLTAPQKLFNAQLRNVVIYRNHRWFEPYKVSEDNYRNYTNPLFKYSFPTMVSGFSSTEKRFYLMELPAENVYRVLDLSNTAQYPRTNQPIRMPFSDYIRNGNYWDADDDGAMISRWITPSEDDYVFLEFILDPGGIKSREDVFISGSFNNWNPDIKWMMNWDPEDRVYRLNQWVRRGRHNYLYGTGKINIDTRKFEQISYDELEGNTVYANHLTIAFVYYRNMDFGGYDAIIGVVAGSPLDINWNR